MLELTLELELAVELELELELLDVVITLLLVPPEDPAPPQLIMTNASNTMIVTELNRLRIMDSMFSYCFNVMTDCFYKPSIIL